MRASALLLAFGALAACTSADEADRNEANVAEAPAPANALGTSPMPDAGGDLVPEAAPSPTPAAPSDTATPAEEDEAEAPAEAETTAQGAARVVQRYYALIGAGDYRRAWRLWRDEGRASGMSAAAFARSFERFAEYRAEVGAPGRIDPGAGQRIVAVPVRVFGRLRDGNRPFNMRGTIVLQRSEVDGATGAQRRWRIRSADVNPRPGEAVPTPAPTEDNRSTARYRCVDGSRLVAEFDPDNARLTLRRGQTRLGVLQRQRSQSGILYRGGGYVFEARGDSLTFTAPGQPPLPCTVNR